MSKVDFFWALQDGVITWKFDSFLEKTGNQISISLFIIIETSDDIFDAAIVWISIFLITGKFEEKFQLLQKSLFGHLFEVKVKKTICISREFDTEWDTPYCREILKISLWLRKSVQKVIFEEAENFFPNFP